jgi:predicted dehydrogenase
MAVDKVRIGVIGTGAMGSGHVRSIPQLEEATLTAICDIDPQTLSEMEKEAAVPAFASYVELLDSGLADAVIIATPHYLHPVIAIEAFKRGIHVLSEKPISVTVSAADAMIAAARRSGCKFAVMYQRRTEPEVQAAHDVVASGILGAIYRTNLIMGWYRTQAYYDSGGWRATWSGEGGGVLINQAPHFLDLFTWLGGMPERVTATTRTRRHRIEVEDEAFATLEYPGGAHGYLYASTNEAPGRTVVEICGDRGKLILDGAELKVYGLDAAIPEFTESDPGMWSSPKSTPVPVDIPTPDPLPGHLRITRNFARAILFNEPLISPGEEGLKAVEMIDAIILSSKSGKPVTLPVPRAEYDALLESLKAQSRPKETVVAQRMTDPNLK